MGDVPKLTEEAWIVQFAAQQVRASRTFDPANYLGRAKVLYPTWYRLDPVMAADLDLRNRGECQLLETPGALTPKKVP